MAEPDGDRSEGLAEGIESSRGDPRVLFVMNAVLSVAFAAMVVWGGALVGVVEFDATTVAVAVIVVFVLTHVVTRP